MSWIEGPRLRRIEHLGLSKPEMAALGAAFSAVEQANEGEGRERDPVLACRGSPMLQCEAIKRLLAICAKMGIEAEQSAWRCCKALDELCALSLEGGWIREGDSDWADRDPAAHALYNHMPRAAMLLVDRGAGVDAQLHDGEPLLVWFARNAGGMLMDFLDRGPDLNARGRDGGTFLHHLGALDGVPDDERAGVSRKAIAKALSRGMDVDVRDHDGRSPLHWAAHMGDREVAQALVEAGADALATCANGSAPWEEASSDAVAEYLEAAALASRESRELARAERDREGLAGAAALELMASGQLAVGGQLVGDLAGLLAARDRARGQAGSEPAAKGRSKRGGRL